MSTGGIPLPSAIRSGSLPGRNNYKPDGVEYFARICRQARQVIWLNPAPRVRWNQKDSILRTYAPYCHKIF